MVGKIRPGLRFLDKETEKLGRLNNRNIERARKAYVKKGAKWSKQEKLCFWWILSERVKNQKKRDRKGVKKKRKGVKKRESEGQTKHQRGKGSFQGSWSCDCL